MNLDKLRLKIVKKCSIIIFRESEFLYKRSRALATEYIYSESGSISTLLVDQLDNYNTISGRERRETHI